MSKDQTPTHVGRHQLQTAVGCTVVEAAASADDQQCGKCDTIPTPDATRSTWAIRSSPPWAALSLSRVIR